MTSHDAMTPECFARRSIFKGAAAALGVGLIPGVLSGCGQDSGTSGDAASSAATGSGSSTDAGATGNGSGSTSIAAASVPVGQAVLVDAAGAQVLVAQPVADTFVAFSAVCTHQQRIVAGGDATGVVCPGHGSIFDLAEGAKVTKGPATQPLAKVAVTRSGANLLVG